MKIIKKERPIAYILFSAIIVLGIVLDQISKLIAVKFLAPVGDVPIIKNVFHFTFVLNDGAAFGMLDNNRWVFMVISTVAIIGMALYIYFGHSGSLLAGSSIALIVSGGIGNMIDRIFSGEVVDFINTCFVQYPTGINKNFKFNKLSDIINVFEWQSFPVFNIADCFVCIGAVMLVVALLIDMVKEMREKREKARGEEE